MTYPSDDETPWVPPRERKVPRMDHTAGWKESAYHPRIGEVICARIEAGETVRQVAADPNMPAYCTIYQWRKVNPEFDAMYRAMRERLARGRIEAADLALRSKVYWRIHKARVDGKRPRDWVHGPPSSYRRDWAEAYCERLIAGQSGMRISADPAMPSARQVYRWLKTIPEFRHMYVEARAIQKIGLETQRDDAAFAAGLDMPRGLARRLGMAQPGARDRVRWLEGRMGRLGAKTWMVEPPARDWPEPPGGGLRPPKR